MSGVEAERSSTTDTQVSLLAYFQDDTRKSWNNHHDQHELEDKALELALARVADNTVSLDKALKLALLGVTDSQASLREILDGRIASLTALGEARDATNETRLADTRRELELLTGEQHTALSKQFEVSLDGAIAKISARLDALAQTMTNADSHLDQRSQERDDADRAITFARIDGLIQMVESARLNIERVSDTRLGLLERLAQTALDAHKREHEMEQKAIEVAKTGQDEKLYGMNEFRNQLREQAASFPTRDYVDTLVSPIVLRLGSLEAMRTDSITRDMLDQRMSTNAASAVSASKANETRLSSLERAQNIAYGVLLVLVFAIPLGLKFIP